MNLVTAIIVENALTNSNQDEQQKLAEKEKTKLAMLEQFRALFAAMDQDGNEVLTKAEFDTAFETDQVSTKLRLLDFRKEDCKELFGLLDTGDGELSLEEFFQGLTRMEGMATARDVFRILKNVEQVDRILNQHSKEVEEDLQQIIRLCGGSSHRPRRDSIRTRANAALHDTHIYSSEVLTSEKNSNSVRVIESLTSAEIPCGMAGAPTAMPSLKHSRSGRAGVEPSASLNLEIGGAASVASDAPPLTSGRTAADSFGGSEVGGDILRCLNEVLLKLDSWRDDSRKRFDLCTRKFEATDRRIEILCSELLDLKNSMPDRIRSGRLV